jgi:hypothetical protein
MNSRTGHPAIVSHAKGSSSYRVKRYRERAEQLRSIADDLLHHEIQAALLKLANAYDAMADPEKQTRH